MSTKIKTSLAENPLPQMPSTFRGNLARTISSQIKKGYHTNIVNPNIVPRLEFLKTSKLLPLDTQRDTKDTWVNQRLEDRNGIDLIALGALSVALDPNTQIYYVWDGCGRWCLIEANGALDTVPCLVYDIPKEQAAYYFAYNQERGRRKLSREVTFVNACVGGDLEAREWENRLTFLGCYIQGQTNYPIPNPPNPGSPEINYRTLVEGYKIAKGDMGLQRQVRDMIYSAWAQSTGCHLIQQDLYFALCKLLSEYPAARNNGLNQAIQKYINWQATGSTQGTFVKSWKQDEIKGLTGNASASTLLCASFIKGFNASAFSTGSHKTTLRILDLKEEIQEA